MSEGYVVTAVDKRDRFGAAGKRITYFDIHILTDRGSTGSLQVDAVDYEAEKVRAALDALYEKLEMPFTLGAS